jgi:phosphatidylcholine synthase
VVLVFAALTFLPVEFVHPVRVRRLRPVTLAMSLAWAILAALVLAADLRPGPVLSAAFLIASAYFATIGFILQVTRRA